MKAYHVTTEEYAKSIIQEGFRQTGKGFGGIWGEGIYAALDMEAIRFYQLGIAGKSQIIDLAISVQNPLIIDVSRFEFPDDVPEAVATENGFFGEYQTEHKKIETENLDIDSRANININLRGGRFELAKFRELNGFVFDPEGVALSRTARNHGYDSIIIHDNHFRAEMGGNQIVVFNSENISII